VLVAAHNEEAVIAGCLENLMQVDYPAQRMQVMPVNDRSSDGTRAIIDAMVEKYPGRIQAFHRAGGKPGKAAALKEATACVKTDFIIVFDADYLPSRGLIQRLMAPFFDPEVGAVMGRVVPGNVGVNLLTRLLDLERSGGYQVDQQARMNLGLVPQYGGTVGGIRMSALQAVGGWHDDVLAEDTDLTFRLLLGGWRTVYHNRSECFEEVPQSWAVRVRQIKRWAKGHNQAMVRHSWALLRQRKVPLVERMDGLLLLGVYLISPLLMVGWLISLLLYFTVNLQVSAPAMLLIAFMGHSALGNFAAFFEIAAAAHLDRTHRRVRLIAFNWLGFIVSAVAIAQAVLEQAVLDRLPSRSFHWDKTVRYRSAPTGPQP
jgi:cellulose synthase/poly-beta-1,6-N-acetylglucosamine synthase-like glycosyltransferase